MLTVPRSVCFRFRDVSGSKAILSFLVARFVLPSGRAHIDDPPSLLWDSGPIGSPVWNEKFGWTLYTGE